MNSTTREHEYNNTGQFSIRAPIERAVAHLKTWKILYHRFIDGRSTRFLIPSVRAIGLYFFELSFQ